MNSRTTVSGGCACIITVPGGHNQTGLLYRRPLWFVQQATHVMVVVEFGASQAVLHTVNFSALLQVLIGAERNQCSAILDDVRFFFVCLFF